MLFKRQDSCHEIGFYGFITDDDTKLMALPNKPEEKIEVYGDSVSAGEVEYIESLGINSLKRGKWS